MKKITFVLLFCFLFDFIMPFIDVFADVNYTFSSGSFHVAYILDKNNTTSCNNIDTSTYDNSNIEYVKSFNTYGEAYKHLNELSDVDSKTLVIIGERKDKRGKYVNQILYSKYGLVDLNTTGTTSTTTYVYTTATNNSVYTYINGHGYFGGVDAAFIDYNNNTSRAKIKMSGAIGWINSLLSLNGSTYTGYDVVPLVSVKSPSYYYVTDDGILVHRLSKKITANNCYSTSMALGKAPSYLESKDKNGNTIKYYSYDGNYFYTSIEDMTNDYREESVKRASNKVPYYNYYMYLPVRSKTNISSDTFDKYLESRNYTSKDKSALYGEGLTFIDAQNKYGVNAVISFTTAIGESGWGTSDLAKTKNNLFGHNAYDSSVMDSASGYKTVADGIYRHAYYYINAGFVETKDGIDRYHGAHLGNKGSGINVKYASDPYWGEKIASQYCFLDNFADNVDYNKYTIGIKTSDKVVDVKSEPNTSSKTIYKLKSASFNVSNIPVIVLGRVSGENINGSDIWYKIQSDALIDKSEEREDTVIRDATIDDIYDWENDYVYIHSSYITLMDDSVNDIYTRKDGIFGLDNLTLDEKTNKVNIKGYLAIEGIDNSLKNTFTYDLVLENENTSDVYELPLNRITDSKNIPFTVSNNDKHDYTYSWFDGLLDFSEIKEGNYTLYIRARGKGYESKELLSNVLALNIVNKYKDESGRGYEFKTNYYLKTIPIELFIRDNGLISYESGPTSDNMFNQYQNIELKDGNLKISGTSFNVGGDYSTKKDVKRKIIFENINTFKRYEFDLDYVDNGDYKITLVVPDNLDKTRAWFNKSIDLTSLEKGTYAIYIKTTSNVEDYGELIDIFARELPKSNPYKDRNYSLKLNENARFRIELTIK